MLVAALRREAAAGHGPLHRPVRPRVQGRDEGPARRREDAPSRRARRADRAEAGRSSPAAVPPTGGPRPAGPAAHAVRPARAVGHAVASFVLRGRGGSRENPDGTMTLVEHLYELRNRLAIALVAIARHHGLRLHLVRRADASGRPALGEVLKGPYCAIPAVVARRVHRRPQRVHAARHRPVRPVRAAPEGRHRRGRRARVPGLAVPDLGVHHPRPLRQGAQVRAHVRLRAPRCCSSRARCWPTSSSPRACRSCCRSGRTCRSPACPATPTSRSSSPC